MIKFRNVHDIFIDNFVYYGNNFLHESNKH